MIQLQITMTGKRSGSKERFRVFADDTKNFKSILQAKEYIKNQYGKSKRAKMFVDTKEGSKHVGYVFGFRNADLSHYPVQKWTQQDWVEFQEVNTITP